MGKKTKSHVKNLNELVDTLKRFKYSHGQGFSDGVIKAAYFLLKESLELVPIDTGFLASTSKVVYSGSGFKTKAKVVYSAFYSIWVHERLDLAHGRVYNEKYAADIAAGRDHPRRPQEQAKFIEVPLRQYRKEMMNLVRFAMRDAAKWEKNNVRHK